MLSFNDYRRLPFQEASVPPVDVRKKLEGLKAYLTTLQASLPREIDNLLVDLRNQIMNPNLPSKRGWWDSIKNWWGNLFGGREDKGNPYYWYNKMGELGRYESVNFDGMGINEYRILNELAIQLEDVGGGPVPRISKILGDWGVRAKQVLSQHIKSVADTVDNILSTMPGSPLETSPVPPVKPSPVAPVDPTKSPVDPTKGPVDPTKGPVDPTKGPVDPTKGPVDVRPAPVAPGATDPAFDTGPVETERPASAPPLAPKIPVSSSDVAQTGLPPEEEAQLATPEAIHDPNNQENIVGLLKNMRRRPKKSYNTQEQKLIGLVWEPWSSLPQSRKRHLNNRGMNGQKRASNNTGQLPVQIPWVLRKDDPRIAILQKFYPDIFEELLSHDNSQWRRIETDADTENTVRERIARFLDRSVARTKGTPPEAFEPEPEPEVPAEPIKPAIPKTVKIGGKPVNVDSLPPEVQKAIRDDAATHATGPVEDRNAPKTVKIGGKPVDFKSLPPDIQKSILDGDSDQRTVGLKRRIENLQNTKDLPDDVIHTLIDDLKNGKADNVERWLDNIENAGSEDEDEIINKFRDLEESSVNLYRSMLKNQSFNQIRETKIHSSLLEKYKKFSMS